MEEKFVKWVKDHRRDLAIVVVTALVTAKYTKGRTMVVKTDDSTFYIPKKFWDKV